MHNGGFFGVRFFHTLSAWFRALVQTPSKRERILSSIPPPVPPAAGGVVHVRARRRRRVRRGWLSKNSQFVTRCHWLDKMSCFSVASHERPFRARQQTLFRIHEQQNFSNFTESQKELKTFLKFCSPFSSFPASHFGKRAVPALTPSSR